ncbi:OLC1v1000999C1 [Oldenlandia corymbosa var. corymbosa]|uniref:OLC1v1000999C1 n=1 Tax=Oldenlandia corymbosa var. corymbosa TaxID=529605 RepID=A0AAV1D7B4_OLDCO|nr:OLC1v1000999C1 [Oldenlandia corymbosa var. corymbosa]
MGLKLFDDGGSDGEADKIEIDREFARRFEYNKEREERQRAAELAKKGVISLHSDSDSDDSSSSGEEVEEEVKGKKKDLEFFDALIKVKSRDPILKDKEAKLFKCESETDDDSDGSDDAMDTDDKNDEKKGKLKKDGKKEKHKPVYLKDVMSKLLIEKGPEYDDDEDDEDDVTENKEEKKVKSHVQEQEELRQGVLEALKEVDGDGGELLKEKSSKGVEGGDDEEEDDGFVAKLDKYFGPDGCLDENNIFLKDYFRKRMWLEAGDNKTGLGNEGGSEIDVSEDEEEIERQEDYEREYNFRFEENAGDRVEGHSRIVEGSVRKKSNTRKLQRERKEERMAQAKFEMKEELKHLKNVKRKEMKEKLRKIRQAAGIGEDGSLLLEEDDLEEEFDPDEFDKMMERAYNKTYYEAEDIDPGFGSENDEDGDELEKPDFEKEDELLGLSKGWENVNGTTDGFSAARERILKEKIKDVDNHYEPQAEGKDEVPEDGEDGKRKKKRKRKLSEVEKAVTEQLLEEFHKLEYEDTIGDLKTRFKYRAVKPKNYGLNTTKVLAMDDKELNQVVSIKKLAPYREKEWKVPRTQILQQKQKIKNPEQGVSNVRKSDKHKVKTTAEKSSSPGSFVSGEQQVEKNASASSPSRRAKRRRRQAQAQKELKISHTRSMAYGNIPVKSKSKKKPSMQE